MLQQRQIFLLIFFERYGIKRHIQSHFTASNIQYNKTDESKIIVLGGFTLIQKSVSFAWVMKARGIFLRKVKQRACTKLDSGILAGS